MNHKDSLGVALMLAGILSIFGCTPGQRGVAHDALDITQTLCLVANQALPDAKILEICRITDPFIRPARDVLAGVRQETAAAAAAGAAAARVGSGGDAGCPARSTP